MYSGEFGWRGKEIFKDLTFALYGVGEDSF